MNTYVLDTNVIILDPYVYLSFTGSQVVIPIVVLEELDHFKNEKGFKGKSARVFFQEIVKYRSSGSLFEGIFIENVLLKIDLMKNIKENQDIVNFNTIDSKILSLCLSLPACILVTNDNNLVLKADALGIPVQSLYEKKDSENLHHQKIVINAEEKKLLLKKSEIPNSENISYDKYTFLFHEEEIFPVKFDNNKFLLLKEKEILNIIPKDYSQVAMMEMLLDNTSFLCFLASSFNKGKTFLTLAAALFQLFEKKTYEKILFFSPLIGSTKEILDFDDNVMIDIDDCIHNVLNLLEEILLKYPEYKKSLNQKFFIKSLGSSFEKSLKNTFFIIDDAQNLTPFEIDSIVKNVAKGSKIVFIGDTDQIDSAYMTKTSNGYEHALLKYKNNDFYASLIL